MYRHCHFLPTSQPLPSVKVSSDQMSVLKYRCFLLSSSFLLPPQKNYLFNKKNLCFKSAGGGVGV
jgi:hypothetical protein